MLLVTLAPARDIRLKMPFPTQPIYEGQEQTVCLSVNVSLGVDPTESEVGDLRVQCTPDGERTEACLTLTVPERWPRRPPTLTCEGTQHTLTMQPVPAFDPTDDVWDGVVIARNVDVVRAVFRLPGVVDAYGSLEGGSCGVKDGTLWMVVPPEPKRQTCYLALPDDEVPIPIRMVKRLDVPDDDTVR
jgi:hypothetical protein